MYDKATSGRSDYIVPLKNSIYRYATGQLWTGNVQVEIMWLIEVLTSEAYCIDTYYFFPLSLFLSIHIYSTIFLLR